MKKAITIISVLVAILIIAGVFLGVAFLNSPEYALIKVAKDVKDSGIKGLENHLTEEAQKTVDAITTISESKLINSIISYT